ncbi:SPW repeat protein [Ectobacillus panaciterrae]|uniref:SPW repeat protein n=1 Tax=Ectobacillus panaciterrae TaxID=363872 RepID=UPI000411E9DE|nr:SPW repeat protein [Ectobacillus panaciterrae]
MKTRSTLNALIGIWFIIAPWVVGFSDQSGAVWSSVVFGAIQLIVSFGGYNKPGWGSWQNWVSVITGVWFVIFPFIFSLTKGEVWSSVILGLITVIFSLLNLGSNSNSKSKPTAVD